ncbi:carotenoid oxygenase family protein [Aquella oligotrophica]|uniref:Uncharacterized protein n=1 Tax=Aquella oligotrophica TaxID=2067065 RepID=A0A2I7N6B6_9NEIS|nr:carotenoid oxygenase family protein [Aquella oligotrophica]AUR51765.1 hypothetical protein CUN60_05475 [Aquella oligotrophica]
MKNSYNFARGFTSLDKEYTKFKIGNPNSLPDWLRGTLLKIGPAHFSIGKTNVKHWFDGLAMLYKFEITDTEILFSNSFIKSSQYNAHQRGKMIHDEFATRAPLGIFDKIKNLISMMSGKDILNPSCNVNIVKIKDDFIAMTEVNNNLSVNPISLTTTGKTKYKDSLKGQMTTAHPVYDAKNGELFNLLIEIAPRQIKYKIYKITTLDRNDSSILREQLAEFSKPYLFYNHSFFVTENYVILYAGPIQTSAARLLTNPFNDSLEYNKNCTSEFIVIERKSGNIKYIPTTAFIFLHGINSYETEEQQLIIDLITYENLEDNPYNKFYLQNLAKNSMDISTAIKRYTLNLDKMAVSHKVITTTNIEFPYINRKYHNRIYNYVWGVYRDESRPNDFFNGLIKQNINFTKDIKVWHQAECYPSEPIFIKNPTSNDEDDGIIMVNVYDANRHLSFLLFLNAHDMTEIVRFDLPCHIPFTLHGNFYNTNKF